jgi:hypothetical protein
LRGFNGSEGDGEMTMTFSVEVRLRWWVTPILKLLCRMASLAVRADDDHALRFFALVVRLVGRAGTYVTLHAD